jgi:D-aminopeptidase
MGAPIGKELGQHAFRGDISGRRGDGSIMIIVATDAPLSDRNLERLAARAVLGLARTGSSGSNGSGDYVIAFSTSDSVRRKFDAPRLATAEISNNEMSGLFQAVAEATEEAVYNSMFMATTTTVRQRTIEALPLDRVRPLLLKYRVAER